MPGPAASFVYPTVIVDCDAVPASLTVVTPNVVRLMSIYFNNTTSGPITVTVTNTAGKEYISAFEVPAFMPISFEYGMLRMTGIKWQASALGLNGQVEGY